MIHRLALHPLVTSTDRRRAERSVWIWGERQGVLVLTPLGVVNTVLRWLHLPIIKVRA